MLESDVPQGLAERSCPDFGEPAWVRPPPPGQRRVAIVSTAGLIQRGDKPFGIGASDYRIIDIDNPAELLMTHISTNFDRSGFIRDTGVVFPLEGLQQAAARGEIGAPARLHYSFMGATDPTAMAPAAGQLARAMAGEGTNVVLLVPV